MSSRRPIRFAAHALAVATASLVLAACGTAIPPEPESFLITSLEGTVAGYAEGPGTLVDTLSDGLLGAGTIDASGNVRVALVAQADTSGGFTQTVGSLTTALDAGCEVEIVNGPTELVSNFAFAVTQTGVEIGTLTYGPFADVDAGVDGAAVNVAIYATGPASIRTVGPCTATSSPDFDAVVLDLAFEAGWNAANISVSDNVLTYSMGLDTSAAWTFEAAP